jgi:hypothetical protein
LARTSRCAIVGPGTKKARDFFGRKPAEGPQRERDLRVERQRRMAAGEDEPQTLVRHWTFRFSSDGAFFAGRVKPTGQFVQLLGKASVAPQAVDRLVARGADHPRPRVDGHAVAPPLRERHGESLLRRLLRQVEVADQADDSREYPPELLVVEAFYRR